jgi:hypothetical protein
MSCAHNDQKYETPKRRRVDPSTKTVIFSD